MGAREEVTTAVQEAKVDAAREYLATDPKPAIQSTALWIYGVAFATSVIMLVATRLNISISQEIAAQGAGFLLAAAVAAWGWYRRKRHPVEVPVEGTKAAELKLP